ncbi:zinc finger and SCAN domain-containing protein 5B [Perognathus longimembris pacificus]|uniref:zinc finger and SCAN domain-containing protein 5B n=1 Tax=Perognathus longimembris pacificus TaxID=214514 RepID=UPI002019C539|nr:zinc finger and SCAN domain-containing protein 5B [Perognathus longimembris pacificus]
MRVFGRTLAEGHMISIGPTGHRERWRMQMKNPMRAQDQDPEVWHLSFRMFSAPENADPVQVLRMLSELCHRWLRPDLHSKEEMLDQLVIEQFLICMPEHLQALVKESGVRRCKDLEEILRHHQEPAKWVVMDVGGRPYLVPLAQLQKARAARDEMNIAMDLTSSRGPQNPTSHSQEPEEAVAGTSGLGAQGPPQSKDVAVETERMAVDVHPDVKREDPWEDRDRAPCPFPQPLRLQGPGAVKVMEGRSRGPQAETSKQSVPASTPDTPSQERKDLADTSRARRRPGPSSSSQEEPQGCATDPPSLRGPMGRPGGRPEALAGRPYQCRKCQKSFQYKSQFVIHQRTHTGERPYKCKMCRKGFMQPSDLRVHQRIHTGEKPYQCSVCDKRFTHESTLLGHMRIHTKETPFHCQDCGMAFSHRGNLNVHRRIHTGEKPYTCRQCGYRFRQLGTCRRHEQRHRKEAARAPCQPRASFVGKAGNEGPGSSQ